MTYLSDRARARKTYIYYGLFILFLGLITYTWPTIQKGVYPYLEKTITSYYKTKTAMTHVPSSIRTYFISREDLSARNMELSLTIERLENEIAEKNSILREQEFLKISGAPDTSSTLVMYSLMRDITSIYSSLILSKGFKDGVEENSLVYIRGRQPVCVIKEVYDRTSLCELLSAEDNTIEGVVASSTVIFLKGKGGGAFVADVPKDTNISLGQTVTLKSDQSMTLGTVADIIPDDQASSWYVYIRGAYNPATGTVFYTDK